MRHQQELKVRREFDNWNTYGTLKLVKIRPSKTQILQARVINLGFIIYKFLIYFEFVKSSYDEYLLDGRVSDF